jgi:hypothetical protein
VHLGTFLKLLNLYLTKLFLRFGIDKQVIEKIFYFLVLVLYLVYVVHILACAWILIGYESPGSWIDAAGLAEDSTDSAEGDSNSGAVDIILTGKGADKQKIKMNSLVTVYVRAIYFIVTTLTTVGYGDFKGLTNNEFIFQMALEFIGIAFFSLLMGSINNLLSEESRLQDILDEKIEALDVWLRKLDSSRSGGKNLPKHLYDSIKNYVEASFLLDFSQIDTTYEFFRQLKPKIRHRLVGELFGTFRGHFAHMFEDEEFEAGHEFTSDFLSSLYCRIFMPGSDIVHKGDKLPELYLIYKGQVHLAVDPMDAEGTTFFILPTHSYFGDYQLILNLRSQFVYR